MSTAPREAIELHRPVTWPGQNALQCLQPGNPLNEDELLRCFEHGAVWWQTSGKPRRLRNPGQIVKPGHQLHLYCNQSTLEPCPHRPEPVADFGRYSVWDKPSGMFSQGSKWGDHWTLQRWVQMHHWPERDCLTVHRLDRHTRGLMLLAHDAEANAALHRLFEQGRVRKTYRAEVRGAMEPGTTLTCDEPIDGRAARTRIRVLTSDGATSLVEAQPETGRKHQIRRHLAHLGHPVVNDRLYGEPPHQGDLRLEAVALEFEDPFDSSARCIRIDLNPAGEPLISI